MNYHTANVVTHVLWAGLLAFLLWGFGWLIHTGETQRHERKLACIEARGVIIDNGDCVPVAQK